jgi:hypothetical protein
MILEGLWQLDRDFLNEPMKTLIETLADIDQKQRMPMTSTDRMLRGEYGGFKDRERSTEGGEDNNGEEEAEATMESPGDEPYPAQ